MPIQEMKQLQFGKQTLAIPEENWLNYIDEGLFALLKRHRARDITFQLFNRFSLHNTQYLNKLHKNYFTFALIFSFCCLDRKFLN